MPIVEAAEPIGLVVLTGLCESLILDAITDSNLLSSLRLELWCTARKRLWPIPLYSWFASANTDTDFLGLIEVIFAEASLE